MSTASDNDALKARGRSLERFEESLKRLDPPAWMKKPASHQSGSGSGSASLRSTTPNESSRPRYSDYKRSCSAQRSATSNSYWRTSEAARTPSSRGPSPGPGSRPATAGGRFQSSSFSRWSASTLCSDGGGQFSSNGNNTPTDSVASAFSMRSSLHGVLTEPITASHHYGNHRTLPLHSRPYLGWRSQDSLIGEDDRGRGRPIMATPAERLAFSYRHGSRAYHHHRTNVSHSDQQPLSKSQASELLVHESIKSVSTAIMEFCQADDVPAMPPFLAASSAPSSSTKGRSRAQIVWLESSFVSAAAAPETTKSKL